MALDIRSGLPAQTSGSIIVRPSTAAEITVSVAGQVLTSATDEANDNVTKFDVSGLSAGTSYPYTATCNGESASGVLQTMPAAGLRIAFNSCMESGVEYMHGYAMTSGRNHATPHMFVDLGDFPYLEFGRFAYGVTTQVVSTDPTNPRAWMNHYLQVWRNTGIANMSKNMHWLGLPDDHQWPGNDVAAAFQAAPNGMNYYNTITTDQAGHDVYLAAGADYYRSYYQGNQWATDASQTNPAGVLYWSIRPNDDAELFGLCQIPYRTIISATDNASKTLLGAAQKAWIKAALLASTATWKIIFSPKQTFPDLGVFAAGDGWGVFTTERAEILDYITTNNINNVIWLVGDRHVPNMVAGNGHIALNASPGGQNMLNTGDGYATNVIWRPAGNFATEKNQFRNYGYVEISEGGQTATLMLIDQANNVMGRWTSEKDSNTITIPSIRYG